MLFISIIIAVFVICATNVIVLLFLTNKARSSAIVWYDNILELSSQLSNIESNMEELNRLINSVLKNQKQNDISSLPVACSAIPVSSEKQNGSRHHKKQKQSGLFENRPSANIEYIYLSVNNGQLSKVSDGQTSYYRAWNNNGILNFEFYSDKMEKAKNNRNVLIEPFCVNHSNSVPVDDAISIVTIEPGILYGNYSLKKKAIIKYTK